MALAAGSKDICFLCARQKLVVTRERRKHAAFRVPDAAPGVTTSASRSRPALPIATLVPSLVVCKLLISHAQSSKVLRHIAPLCRTDCATLSRSHWPASSAISFDRPFRHAGVTK